MVVQRLWCFAAAAVAMAAALAEGGALRGIPLITEDGPSKLNVPSLKLNNGVELPMLGLGTWQYNSSTAFKAVLNALHLGYPLVDTAAIYGNQKGVGMALKMWQVTGGIRENVFVTTKIAGGLNYSAATAALESTLEELKVDYVDLMLVHMPASWELQGGKKARIEGWRAMEEFYKAGKARAIGVSHFCKNHLEDILESGTIKPAVNQVEYHVGMGHAGPNATDYKEWSTGQGVLYSSFSPLCGPCNTEELISGDMVTRIGVKYNKTGAQVSLRWQVQQGIPVIPKTNSRKHMLENADIFAWSLSEEDMQALTDANSPPATGGGGDGTSGDCKIA